jgi:hypothetical protein
MVFEELLFLAGVAAGALLAWCPRLVVLRLNRRVRLLEETYLSDRNKKAAKARWEADPKDDPTVQALLNAKKVPADKLDNEWTFERG